MSNYVAKQGETISDIVLNGTGSLASWDAILTANDLDDWTPEVLGGEAFIIPADAIFDLDALVDLVARPACNLSVASLRDQIDAIFTIMETAAPVDVPVFTPEVVDTSKKYYVKAGESIYDAVINATGTLANLNLVLDANGFEDWTPILVSGQALIIPDTVTNDPNAFRQFEQYPVSNTSVNNIDDQIISIFELINDYWILTTGYWNDLAIWKDEKTWID